jgi:hypothetical protein
MEDQNSPLNNPDATDTSTGDQPTTETQPAADQLSDPNVPLHKDARFQELRQEVSELKATAEQMQLANADLQKAVTALNKANTQQERNSIVDNLIKDLDSKAGELLPSDLVKGIKSILKAEEDEAQAAAEAQDQRTAQEMLASFQEVQTLEDLSTEEVDQFAEWMLEMLNKNGDKKIYSDPHRAFRFWDEARKVAADAEKTQEGRKSRSSIGGSSSDTGGQVKISWQELARMSPLDAKRRSQGT